MVMIYRPVAHGAQIDPLALILFFQNDHKLPGKADDLLVDPVRSFAQVMVMLNSGNAHMAPCPGIADEEALNVPVFIDQFVCIVAVDSPAGPAVQARRTYPQVHQFSGCHFQKLLCIQSQILRIC